ncbi:MAG: hypothetical protein QXG65_03600 [Thermoplasmata archaeon]
MPSPPLLLRRGDRVLMVSPGGPERPVGPTSTLEELVGLLAGREPTARAAFAGPGGPAGRPEVEIASEDLADLARSEGWRPRPAPIERIRRELSRIPREAAEPDRGLVLALAEASLARALSDPEQSLEALAREEERLERIVRREENARADLGETGGSPALAEYRGEGEEWIQSVRHRHRQAERAVDRAAREAAPILSELLGAKAAARLLASAGGVAALARMPASRLQLLGTKRRPAGGRGPRFGHIYRARRMEEVPMSRQGAYARSLAALAVIAARMDLAKRPVEEGRVLTSRRDRRIAQLCGSGRGSR